MELWSYFLVLISCVFGADDFYYECIHNKEDFTIAGWTNISSLINWASDESQLPEGIRGKLRGQFQDVFYFDSSQQFYSGKARKDYKSVTAPYPAYIYYKYYAHDPNDTAEFYVKEKNWYYWLDEPNDFQWKEDMQAVPTSNQIEFGMPYMDRTGGNYFLIDTIIYAQGKYLDLEEMKALCPEESHAILECINYDTDFSYGNWQSYPSHSYVDDPTDLPVDHQGSLNASGIFFMEGSSSYKTKMFLKDFRSYSNWAQIPTYAYLKYYAALRSNNSQVVYIRPVIGSLKDNILELVPGSGYNWEEIILNVENSFESDDMKIVELGVENLQSREYLFLDKIAVVRATSFQEALELILSCVQD